MDYSKFGWQEFEMLCARLLQASGYTLQRQGARSQDIGVDFTFTDPSGETWVAEVKHFTRPRTGTTILRQAAVQLNSAKQLTGATNGLLIVSMLLPQNLTDDIEAREGITVWDSRRLNDLLASRPEVEQDFLLLLDAQAVARRGLEQPAPLDPRAHISLSRTSRVVVQNEQRERRVARRHHQMLAFPHPAVISGANMSPGQIGKWISIWRKALFASIAFATVISSLARPSAAIDALVVSRDGVAGRYKFGEVVECDVSADKMSVTIGDDTFPAVKFGFDWETGCFEVGIQQGIDQGLFENAEFRGTGGHRTVQLKAEISASITRKICPKVEAPFLLEAEPSQGEDLPQRMIVVGPVWPPVIEVPERKAGEDTETSVDLELDAYCADYQRRSPEPKDQLHRRQISLTRELEKLFAAGDADQSCVWAAFPASYWRTMAIGQFWLKLVDETTNVKELEDHIRKLIKLNTSACDLGNDVLTSWSTPDLEALRTCARLQQGSSVQEKLKHALAACVPENPSLAKESHRKLFVLIAATVVLIAVFLLLLILRLRRRRRMTQAS